MLLDGTAEQKRCAAHPCFDLSFQGLLYRDVYGSLKMLNRPS